MPRYRRDISWSKRHTLGLGICTSLSNGVSEDVYINIDLLGGGETELGKS